MAVVGCGSWATHAHLPAIASDPRAQLVAVVDTDADARIHAQRSFGGPRAFASVPEMLDQTEVDAAVVAVPHAAHAPAALALIEAGAHVLIEKPMVINPSDGRRILVAASHHAVEVVVGYTWHYNRQVMELRRAILGGAIGDVEFTSCLFGSTVREYYRGHPDAYDLGYVRQPAKTTYSDPKLSGGGQGQAQLTHAAALLFHLTGLRPQSLSATTESFGLAVDLADALAIRFDNGSIGVMGSTGGVLFGHREVLELRIFGTEGHVTFDVMQGQAAIHRKAGQIDELPPLPPDDRYPMYEPARNLIEIAARGAANLSPGSLGLVVVELLDAMYRSSRADMAPVSVAAERR
ncbi:MAG: hypothetical protein QOF27_1934 [Gaiellaceae bacterium]|nr:hypothetical protein [Gaiellaceae bacterium]